MKKFSLIIIGTTMMSAFSIAQTPPDKKPPVHTGDLETPTVPTSPPDPVKTGPPHTEPNIPAAEEMGTPKTKTKKTHPDKGNHSSNNANAHGMEMKAKNQAKQKQKKEEMKERKADKKAQQKNKNK